MRAAGSADDRRPRGLPRAARGRLVAPHLRRARPHAGERARRTSCARARRARRSTPISARSSGSTRCSMDEPVPTPDVHGFEPAEDTPFGGPFFVMDRLDGPRAERVAPPRPPGARARTGTASAASPRDLADNLAAHPLRSTRTARPARPRRADFRQTIDHWAGVYEEMRLVRDPVVDEAYAWVRAREPEPVAPALVHGDYRIGNCLIDGGRVTGILDWELSLRRRPALRPRLHGARLPRRQVHDPGLDAAQRDGRARLVRRALRGALRPPGRPEVVRTFTALGALMLFAIMTHRHPRLRRRRRGRHPHGLGAFRAARAPPGPRRR